MGLASQNFREMPNGAEPALRTVVDLELKTPLLRRTL